MTFPRCEIIALTRKTGHTTNRRSPRRFVLLVKTCSCWLYARQLSVCLHFPDGFFLTLFLFQLVEQDAGNKVTQLYRKCPVQNASFKHSGHQLKGRDVMRCHNDMFCLTALYAFLTENGNTVRVPR